MKIKHRISLPRLHLVLLELNLVAFVNLFRNLRFCLSVTSMFTVHSLLVYENAKI